MHQFYEYKAKIIRLDKQLQAVFDADTTDHERVAALQKELDAIAECYDSQGLGKYYFKVHELRAYIHFLNGELSHAQRLLAEAVQTRGSNYLDAERLKHAIYTQKRRRNASIREKHRRAATKRIYEGIAWLAAGLAFTGILYVMAAHTAEQHAIRDEETSYGFNYVALTGTIIIGDLQILRGSYDLAAAPRSSRAAIRQSDSV